MGLRDGPSSGTAKGLGESPRTDNRAEESDAKRKKGVEGSHIPVLFQEVLDGLQVESGGRYIDATLGGGGHSEGILEASSPAGCVLGLDRDPAAVEMARSRLAPYAGRITLRHTSYAFLADVASASGYSPADGVLLDLGLSSSQLSDPARGFSFLQDGPLDMRFDPASDCPTAAALVNELSFKDLMDILYQFGEEVQARRIAEAIVSARPLHTTTELAEVVERAVGGSRRRSRGRRSRIHVATQTFQALRIAVNEELATLQAALPQAVDVLAPGGRLAIISFHSLEDRLVKRFMRRESRDCICPPEAPACMCDHRATLRLVTRKPVRPTGDEVATNPRSRSARLRVAERIGQ